jgi:hypothetical protein
VARLAALALAAALAAGWPAAAGWSEAPPSPQPRTAVVTQPAELSAPGGGGLGRAERGQAYRLAGRREGCLVVETPGGQALLPAGAAVVVAGEPAAHRRRIARILDSSLGRRLADRLLAGRIQKGDHMFQVEMAWGLPDRSFMVNYFSDEQHYVYLPPGGGPVLLRMKAGRLDHQPPAPTLGQAASLESPPGPR